MALEYGALVLAAFAGVGCGSGGRPEPGAAPMRAAAPAVAPEAAYQTSNDWKVLATEAFRGKRDDIYFVDEQTGWYGTGAGDLFATTDGGATWSKVASRPGTFIRALAFVDAQLGFIGNVGTGYYPGVTDTTPLYRTRDGGKTWEPVDTGGKTITGVCAIDIVRATRIHQGKHVDQIVIHAAGRVGGPAGLLRSVDGGATWSVIDMSAHAGMILDVHFQGEHTGMVFASTDRDPQVTSGLILKTTDGGATWKRVYQGTRPTELVWKASFPTRDVGYATVQSYDPRERQQRIVKTIDGGGTWTELPMIEDPAARQFGIGFVDPEHGWVGTMAGGFYTADGGRSFSKVSIAPAANKFRVVPGAAGPIVFAIGTEVQKLAPAPAGS